MAGEERKDKKNEAASYGRLAELRASQEYARQGYAVVEKQWHHRKSEIDLVLQKDDLIVVAEVKYRTSGEEDAIASVTKDKKKRMVRAADNFIRKSDMAYNYRFDIVACWGDEDNLQISIIEDAFLSTDIF